MEWEHNPSKVDIGIYLFKQKKTHTPNLLVITPQNYPIDLSGWWSGPLELQNLEDILDTTEISCKYCLCWRQKGITDYGQCGLNPPTGIDWSSPRSGDSCFQFNPNYKLILKDLKKE